MRLTAVGLVLCVAVAGCRAQEAAPPPDVLVAGIRPIGSLDPVTVSTEGDEDLVDRQIFEGLTSYDPRTLEAKAALASSWTVGPDARTFTFLLRPGARFHNGEPVTAADVAASLNRLARTACVPASSPVAGAPAYLLSLVVGYPEVAQACRGRTLAGLQAVGENTISIALSEPWADFPAVLAHPATSILPEDFGDPQAFARDPVGTGPYRIASPWDGRRLRLEAFADHWGPAPAVGRVEFVGYREDSLAYADLLAGKLHYAAVPTNRAAAARRRFGEDGFALRAGLFFFGFNLRSPKVRDPGFRRALSNAVDRTSLAAGIFEGTREVATAVASPALPGSDPQRCGRACAFDADDAKETIASVFPEGPPELVIGVSDEGSNPAVADAVVGMFGKVGVRARVLVRPFVDHVKRLEAGDVDMFQFGWVPAYPTMDGMLRQLFRTGSPDNQMRYSNPEVDKLMADARRLLADGQRFELYTRAEQLILQDMPLLPLLWYRSSLALDPRLSAAPGLPVDGLGLTSFAALRWDGG
jgi:ABC-type transport system substrate-binding protein